MVGKDRREGSDAATDVAAGEAEARGFVAARPDKSGKRSSASGRAMMRIMTPARLSVNA